MWIYVLKAMKHMPLLTKHILQREWIIIFKREWRNSTESKKVQPASFRSTIIKTLGASLSRPLNPFHATGLFL